MPFEVVVSTLHIIKNTKILLQFYKSNHKEHKRLMWAKKNDITDQAIDFAQL